MLRIEELTADDYEVAMVTVDEELISFYPKGQLSEGGASVLRFTREQVEGAIDRIFAHTVIKLVSKCVDKIIIFAKKFVKLID